MSTPLPSPDLQSSAPAPSLTPPHMGPLNAHYPAVPGEPGRPSQQELGRNQLLFHHLRFYAPLRSPADFLGQTVPALLLPIQELLLIPEPFHAAECLGQPSHDHSRGCLILFGIKAPKFKMVLKTSA